MTGTNTEERLAAFEQKTQMLAGQIEALEISLSACVALLRGTDPCDLQIALARELAVLAGAHTPLPDEHHTRGFHQTLTAIAGNLKTDLEEN